MDPQRHQGADGASERLVCVILRLHSAVAHTARLLDRNGNSTVHGCAGVDKRLYQRSFEIEETVSVPLENTFPSPIVSA